MIENFGIGPALLGALGSTRELCVMTCYVTAAAGVLHTLSSSCLIACSLIRLRRDGDNGMLTRRMLAVAFMLCTTRINQAAGWRCEMLLLLLCCCHNLSRMWFHNHHKVPFFVSDAQFLIAASRWCSSSSSPSSSSSCACCATTGTLARGAAAS